MNARTLPNVAAAPAPRFDRKFIEEHRLVERYLQGQLPARGARDLEAFLRTNPDFLDNLKLGERTQYGLKLLEAVGKPVDLQEPTPPWWKSPYVLIGCAVLTVASLLGFWVMFAKVNGLEGRLADTRHVVDHGPLRQPTAAQQRSVKVTPSRVEGGSPQVTLSRTQPELLDLHIDMAYTAKLNQFRVYVDKKDQGRALVLNDIMKDSNNELRLTLNSTGLAAGLYTARIEALPFKGSPIPIGWLTLEVR